jgi:hypothetical protein
MSIQDARNNESNNIHDGETKAQSTTPVETATENKETAKQPVEHSPRLFGYVLIMLTSLLNFASCASVPGEQRKEYYIMVSFMERKL